MTPQPSTLLRRGDRGPAVAEIRERLTTTGDLAPSPPHEGPAPDVSTAPTLPEDEPVFDAEVERAVRAFQQRRGLLVDGIVGPSTYLALDGARWALGDRVLSHVPDHFVEGDDVLDLQSRLVELGFGPRKVDGIFGPETERAVRAFQAAVGTSSDGTVGPETMRALGALRRSVVGGSANALRDRELIRRSGHHLSGRTVVLDPGHGGPDPGASGGGLSEATVALDLARRIEGRLSAHGVTVVFTRTESTDGGTDRDRAEFANSCDADLVLSLHSDHSSHTEAQGVAAFFYGRQDRGGWSSTGEHLADLLLREVVARSGLVDCRAHARTWPLLRRTRMPAVRLEVGYLTHPDDAQVLSTPQMLDRIAEGVVVALQRLYLGEADPSETGVLRLDDLRRHVEEMRLAAESSRRA